MQTAAFITHRFFRGLWGNGKDGSVQDQTGKAGSGCGLEYIPGGQSRIPFRVECRGGRRECRAGSTRKTPVRKEELGAERLLSNSPSATGVRLCPSHLHCG